MFDRIQNSYRFSFLKPSAEMEGAENKSMLQQKEVEAAKGDNLGNKQQSGAHKKPIQNGKSNHTVPRPFMFATEKRISREKRGSMDLNESKQKLSKSVSFNTSVRRIVSAPISSKVRGNFEAPERITRKFLINIRCLHVII